MARKLESAVPGSVENDDTEQHRCSVEYSGMRCRYTWVVSQSTRGGAGVCNQHHKPPAGKSPMDIILESRTWEAERSTRKQASV